MFVTPRFLLLMSLFLSLGLPVLYILFSMLRIQDLFWQTAILKSIQVASPYLKNYKAYLSKYEIDLLRLVYQNAVYKKSFRYSLFI